MSEALQQLKIKQTPPMEQFFDFCRYIIQWLFLANNNWIKPIHYSQGRHPDITSWHDSLHPKFISLSPDPHDNATLSKQHLPVIQHPIIQPSIQNTSPTSHDSSIQQLTVSTLIQLKESLEAFWLRAEKKDEQKERGFHKLPSHCKRMILNASSQPPFTTKKSAFKVKQVIDHELKHKNVECFKTMLKKVNW